ncbi:MAG: hypothetical protein HKN82_15450 [Akkermansiaceae bacterium]|nr:hypothetical protein [Akkermansiaceae bacterium]NNM28913.1 hypothetical protein [Akkermansiaceae bacterium]
MKYSLAQPQFKAAAAPRRRWRSASVLVEAVIAMVVLAVVSIVLLRGSLVVLAPRQWTMIQNLTDAHMTFEKAFAERTEFSVVNSAGSPWPIYPARSTTQVTLGQLPGGRVLMGTVVRTRVPDDNNLAAHGGTGTLASNPAEMQVWKLQSHLSYSISNREYLKSRTVVRTR